MSSEQSPAASSDSRLPTVPAQDMGDVLAKEQAEAAESSQPAQPPPVATGPPPIELLAGQRPPDGEQLTDDDDDRRPDSPATQSSETKEDRLSTDVVLSEQNSIENAEDSAASDNDDQCQTASTTTDDLCNCEDCNGRKKDLSSEDWQEMMKLRRLGMDLRQYIRYSFNWYMENPGYTDNKLIPVPLMPQELENSDTIKSFVELQESVALLYDKIPCHLFMWLVGQAQEFVIGVKVQLLTLLYDRSIDNLAEVFLTKLLDGYDALVLTAEHISDLLKPLQEELLNKVDLSWKQINKRLYQNYVYSDPLIQNNLPPFIGQLRKHLPIQSSEYHDLVHRYLRFDDEITKIGPLSAEIERLIDKYNAEQVTGSVMKKVREDFERFKTRLKDDESSSSIDLSSKNPIVKEGELDDDDEEEDEDSVKNGIMEGALDDKSDFQSCSLPNANEIHSMFNDWKKSPQQRLADLVEALTLSTTEEDKSKNIKEGKCYPASFEKSLKDDIIQPFCDKDCECKSCPVLSIGKLEVAPSLVNNNVKADGNDVNKSKAQSTQTQTRHTTTQTPSINHNLNNFNLHRHHHHQGRCSSHSHLHGSVTNGVIKSVGPQRTHVAHNNHPSAAVTCHKQQHIVEHIKRLSTNDLSPGENGDSSDSASSHEDCSATNSPTPRDSNRHCDCCYCEVFGHGVPSVAPVSRNYNEMRERLRQLLSKKKAKVCVSSCNTRPKNSAEVSSSSSSLSSSSSTSSTTTNVDAATLPNPASRTLPPVAKNANTVSPSQAYRKTLQRAVEPNTNHILPFFVTPKDEKWDLDAAVEFIEGAQNGKKNDKKAEKKARQKQKKAEEKLKKDKEEEERLKLIELQKKTPEVTITVVHPQKQGSQKATPQQKLPEVSILPAKSAPQPMVSSKQANSTKKKNTEVVSNTTKNANKAKSAATATAAEGAKKKTASVDKTNEASNNTSNTKSKSPGKSEASEPVPPPPVDLSTLTKKERKKLRREMEKQEALKKELDGKQPAGSSEQLQIVTIKRIMESINSEPTVTITLKGQTPAEDRVLFTLVNGQTKDSEGDKQQQSTGKKKKNKANNSANQQQSQTASKSQQSASNTSNAKSEVAQKTNSKNANQQQTTKAKTGKQQEEPKPRQQPTANAPEVKVASAKSKKDKKKNNNENKENIKQPVNESSQKQESNSSNKKSNKTGTVQTTVKQQQCQPTSNSNSKNAKANKNQNQSQNQSQSQNPKKNANVNQMNLAKGNAGNNQSGASPKSDNQKAQKTNQSAATKQKQAVEVPQQQKKETADSSLNRKSTNTPTTINIENLKLPPGITITKVDAPTKPISIKTNTAPKPASSAPKQTTIIAAPLSGIQATGYGNPQGTGNVIVVDTGRLKQDLMPKNSDKDSNNQSASSKKKKKKKNKNAATANGAEKVGSPAAAGTKNSYGTDYASIEPARILHNPSTNMVTIRNPAFGPPPPKMEACPNQAAIIKVGDNGMVTIRSPALQQAINMGLTPPPKPDFVVKGSPSSQEPQKPSHNNYMNSNDLSGNVRGSNGVPLTTDIAELRRRLAQPPENDRSSSTLFNNGLSSIQISKVTNGQSPNIPENGINLKGTSVTLTKIRNSEMPSNQQQQQQQQPIFDEAAGNGANGNAGSKNRKKKNKRGNGVRQGGDDWNLVESVFTPKDIDLEDGEMDDAERELEAFKRFCLQSVPPPRKEKVNLNLKDIVLKKKSSASQANAPVLAAI